MVVTVTSDCPTVPETVVEPPLGLATTTTMSPVDSTTGIGGGDETRPDGVGTGSSVVAIGTGGWTVTDGAAEGVGGRVGVGVGGGSGGTSIGIGVGVGVGVGIGFIIGVGVGVGVGIGVAAAAGGGTRAVHLSKYCATGCAGSSVASVNTPVCTTWSCTSNGGLQTTRTFASAVEPVPPAVLGSMRAVVESYENHGKPLTSKKLTLSGAVPKF